MSLFRRYVTKEDGTTAVEFSLLAMPFVFTVLCILELGLYFTNAMLLEAAVQDASRLIRTGQLQQAGGGNDPLTMFLNALCQRGGVFMNCDNFQYEVRQMDNFAADTTPTVSEEGDIVNQFDIGELTAGCVALVRVTYPFQFMTPIFGSIWSNYPNNTRLLMSTVVFQTEPYNFIVTDPNCSV